MNRIGVRLCCLASRLGLTFVVFCYIISIFSIIRGNFYHRDTESTDRRCGQVVPTVFYFFSAIGHKTLWSLMFSVSLW